jgi:hypothetical protein
MDKAYHEKVSSDGNPVASFLSPMDYVNERAFDPLRDTTKDLKERKGIFSDGIMESSGFDDIYFLFPKYDEDKNLPNQSNP